MTEGPKRREVGIDIGSGPDIFESITKGDIAALDIVLGEDNDIRIPVGEVFIRRMTLDKLIHRNLLSA